MLDWIAEGFRWLVWGLSSACLKLMDICYELIKNIALADFLNDDTVWRWYYTFMLFLGVLIMGRSIAIFFKFTFDEEFREKISGSYFINKFISIALVIALLPTCLGFISQLSSWSIRNVSIILGTESSSKPSTMIITAFMNTDNGEYDADGNWVKGEKVTYTLDDIDINAEGEGDDDYKFFNDIADLFIMAMIGISAAIMMILNGIMIGKRLYSIVMKFCIAPIPISSMIVPGDETFSMWRKMIISDYLLNYIQTIMIMMIMILSGSSVLQNASFWIQIISFISGLLLLLSGIPELARIIGGDTSQGSVLQQLASFRMATRGMGHGAAAIVGSAFGSLAGGAKTLGASATYGAGRMLGGESISNMKDAFQKQGSSENGFMGGGTVNPNEKASFGSDKQNIESGAFHEPSTKAQQTAAKYFGIENAEKMSKGDASLALEKAGADKSYWSANTDPNISTASEDFTSAGTASSASINNKSNSVSFARPDSPAGKFSAKAAQTTGLRGAPAKLATNASRHLYQASAQRLSQTKAYRYGVNSKKAIRNLKGGNSDDISGS